MIWLDALQALAQDGEPAILVTVVTARGSTPREAGTKMLVTATGQHDTIGGGNLEHTCIAAARAMLTEADTPVLRSFPLGPGLGQCCGGHVSVLFEPIRPPQRQIAIFGAGHVGRALASVLAPLPFRVTLIDTRPETLADAPRGIRICRTTDPVAELAGLPAGAEVLILTHDHQLDFQLVAEALRRPDLSHIGLIGSATKRARFVSRLARLGFSADMMARLICPIGLPGIGGKRPAEIAIAVAAQLLSPAPSPIRSDREVPMTETACGLTCAHAGALT